MLTCNGKELNVKVCIMNLPVGKQFLLGNNVMFLLGISISGVSIDFSPIDFIMCSDNVSYKTQYNNPIALKKLCKEKLY